MTRILHVVNRAGVFYWRRRLPADVATAFGRPQILISMKSRDPKSARRIAQRLSATFDQFLYRMQLEKRLPTKQEQAIILRQLYKLILDECHEERARHYASDEVPAGALLLTQSSAEVDDPLPREERDRQSFFMNPKETAEALRRHLIENRYSPIRWLLKPILADYQIDVEADEIASRKFLRLAIQLAAQAFDDADGEINGDCPPSGLDALLAQARADVEITGNPTERPRLPSDKTGPREASAAASPLSATPKTSHPISFFVGRFLKEDKDHVTAGTAGQKSATLKLLIKVVGDIPADTVRREDAKKLRATLERLPATYGKSSRHAEMSVDEILAGMKSSEKTMSLATLNRHWRTIVAFYRYVNVQDDVTPINLDRVFGEFRWSPSVPGEKDRIPWDDQSLVALFSSPIWKGFSPHPGKRYWRHEPGDVIVKDEHWWLPLLGLYHGARQEELCQLRGTDIFVDEESKVAVMNFHEGMKLKTKASVRKVPIHSAVIKLGFMELAQKAGSNLLFPKMQPGGRDRKYAFEYSQQFSEYRKAIGVYKELMDFHSFRHNLTTKMIDEGGRSILEVDEITGHDSSERKDIKAKNKTETMRYFAGHRLTRLREALETVAYPQIDIDGLSRLAAESVSHEARLAKQYPRAWGQNPQGRRRSKGSGRVPSVD
jgi:integrase